MPSQHAILQAALETITNLVNISTGMSHSSDKRTVVWVFKLLKKHGVPLEPEFVRRTMLNAGMSVSSANEVQEAAERIQSGGYFTGVGSTAPFRADIFEQWTERASELEDADVEEEEKPADAPTKPFRYTDRGPSMRVSGLGGMLHLARSEQRFTLIIPRKADLGNYSDMLPSQLLSALKRNGRGRLRFNDVNYAVTLIPATKYRGYGASGPALIVDCDFETVERAYYNDDSITGVVYVPWRADEVDAAAAIPGAEKLS